MAPEPRPKPDRDEEPPPLFRSWALWYLVVLGNLAVLIVLFYLFTRYFS